MIDHKTAKISIIIPTIGDRQKLLQRAIISAFIEDGSFFSEIIVVINGSKANYFSLPCNTEPPPNAMIRVVRTEKADANHARNLGIKHATGELVRFLDDDDYLIQDASRDQYHLMLRTDLDFCSGNAEVRDSDNSLISSFSQPDEATACATVLSRKRLQLTFTHVYRRSSLKEMEWPVGLRQSEDIVWLIRYVTAAPRRWQRFDQAVGVWYQHAAVRQSLDRPSGFVHEATAQALLEARATLAQQGRWNDHLAHITAEALWDLVHKAFPFRPRYWSSIGAQARLMDHTARPAQPVYGYPGLRHIDPRLMLWLLLPKRWATLGWTSAKGLLKGHDYRRTL
ncbi:MAG: glycosyltransferase [Burkholderiaceae bacterium]